MEAFNNSIPEQDIFKKYAKHYQILFYIIYI